MNSPTELAEAFRAQGLKVTPQRRLLFALLEDDTTHPTADGLFARASAHMPGISLRTVYTTLTDLVLTKLDGTAKGGVLAAMRFDPNVDDHHHGVCDACGAVVDLYVDGDGILADTLVVSSDGGVQFTPISASIVFRGTCAACQHSL